MTTETNTTAAVTVLPMTAAAKRATSPVKISKAVKKVTAAKRDTFTSVDLAAEKGINAKTLRARIRRNIAKWEPLFAGEKHTFKDNVTTRKAIDALLAAAE